jgi:hypothetical protein
LPNVLLYGHTTGSLPIHQFKHILLASNILGFVNNSKH